MNWEFDPFFIRQVRDGNCVLFAGAGLSAAAGYPSWASLVQGILQAAAVDQPGLQVAGLEALIKEGRLLDAAAHLREAMGDEAFFAALRELLDARDVAPSPVHQLLTRLRFRAIVTTNFDQLIERAFDGRLPVATQKDAQALASHLGEGTPFIFKVHGDIDRPDTIVLTNDEFARVMVDNKALKSSFSALLLMMPLLFVGYSHSDPDFDLLLREHVMVFGQGGARRYALMQVGDERDAILAAGLQRKSVQVLSYRSHDEVPEFFRRLVDAVEASPAPVTTAPPLPAAPDKDRNEGLPRRRRPAGAVGQRYAVLIPGLFGSKLASGARLGEKEVWLNPWRLMTGGLRTLDLAAAKAPKVPKVRATDLLAQFSLPLAAGLGDRREVLPFAYDWRLDFRQAAEQLRRFVDAEVPEGASCDLVAVGEGGLLARAFIADHRGTWRRLQGRHGSRLVMLGTPNHGTFQAVLMLLGSHPMVTLLGRLDLVHSAAEVRRVLASFPSLYQCLPSPLFNAAWAALYRRQSYGSVEVDAALLEDGLRFHADIAGSVEPDRMVSVLGGGKPTVVSVGDPSQLDGQPPWALSDDGDGSVVHSYAMLGQGGCDVPAYTAGVEHAALGTDERVARAVADILDNGRTSLLPRWPMQPPGA